MKAVAQEAEGLGSNLSSAWRDLTSRHPTHKAMQWSGDEIHLFNWSCVSLQAAMKKITE